MVVAEWLDVDSDEIIESVPLFIGTDGREGVVASLIDGPVDSA